MSAIRTPHATEGAIWDRLVHAERYDALRTGGALFPAVGVPPEDKERMHELAAKAPEGTLSAAERAEVRNYEQVGNLLALMKSKARQRLKRNGSSVQ